MLRWLPVLFHLFFPFLPITTIAVNNGLVLTPAAPKLVTDKHHDLQQMIEAHPDRWFRERSVRHVGMMHTRMNQLDHVFVHVQPIAYNSVVIHLPCVLVFGLSSIIYPMLCGPWLSSSAPIPPILFS
jgi:hypothetical protein